MSIRQKSVEFLTQPAETTSGAWTKIGAFWGLMVSSGGFVEFLQIVALLVGIAFTASQLYILWADRKARKERK